MIFFLKVFLSNIIDFRKYQTKNNLKISFKSMSNGWGVNDYFYSQK